MLSVSCKHPASESFLKVEKEKNYNFFLTDLLSESVSPFVAPDSEPGLLH